MANSSFALWLSSILDLPFLLVFDNPPDPGVDVAFLLPGVLGAFFGVVGPLSGLGPPYLVEIFCQFSNSALRVNLCLLGSLSLST